MSFENKNILIAGGSSGIGLSLVNMLVKQGAIVYVISRNPSTAWHPGVTHLAADVTGSLENITALLPEVLHGFAYCVGSITLKPFNRLTDDDFLKDYHLNVIGAAKILRLCIAALKKAAGASVVLTSSVAAQTGMPYHASIAAAKSGVEGLTMSLAAELAPLQIRVNAVAPSLTDTPMANALLNTAEKREASAKRHPLGKIGQPDDVSEAIAFLLSDNSTWVTGQIIGIDGGMGKLKTM